MELETAEKRIEELEKDLALNARMLAKQCDMAREAEFQASLLGERIAAIKDIVEAARTQIEAAKALSMIAEVLECETINIRRRG